MNRRDALRWGLGLTSALALSRFVSAAPATIPAEAGRLNGAGVYRRPLGELELWTVSDGYAGFPTFPTFGGRTASQEAVIAEAKRLCVPTDTSYTPFNTLVVRTPDALVMIDTGYGDTGRAAHGGQLLGNLKRMGLAPEVFTHVVISHAHPDHLWGAVSQGRAIFPKAEVVIGKTEHAFWNRSDRDIAQAPEAMRGMLTTTRDILRVLEPKTRIAGPGDTVVPGLTLIDLPGHTPGHLGVKIESQGKVLYFVADLANHARLLFAHPEWDFSFDNDVATAVATRKRMLKQAADEQALIFGTHLAFPGFGHVLSQDEGYFFLPEPMQFGWEL